MLNGVLVEFDEAIEVRGLEKSKPLGMPIWSQVVFLKQSDHRTINYLAQFYHPRRF